MLIKKGAICFFENRLKADPFCVDGKFLMFGSHEEAQQYIDAHNLNPNGSGGYSPVEIYVPR